MNYAQDPWGALAPAKLVHPDLEFNFAFTIGPLYGEIKDDLGGRFPAEGVIVEVYQAEDRAAVDLTPAGDWPYMGVTDVSGVAVVPAPYRHETDWFYRATFPEGLISPPHSRVQHRDIT